MVSSLTGVPPASLGVRPGPAGGADGTRSFGLDIARAVAITLVFASHTVAHMVGPMAHTALEWAGRGGVELFFALSGFLIGNILIKLAERGLGPRAVAGFLFRRWMRTLPLYYAVLLYAGWFFSNQNPHAFLLVQNFFPAEPRVLPASWSLVMEEYFYFFFPLAMLALTAALGQGVRVVWATALGLIAVCLAGRVAITFGVFSFPVAAIHENPFVRMDCAAYGVVAALLMRPGGALRTWLTPFRASLCLALAVLAVSAWAWLFVAVLHATPEGLVRMGFMSWGKGYIGLQWSPVAPVFTVAVVALAQLRLRPPPVLGSAVLCLSLWSYSLYLWHTVVIVWAEYYGLGQPGPARLGVVVGLSLAVSAASYALIERPVLWLRDRAVRGAGPMEALPSGPMPASPSR